MASARQNMIDPTVTPFYHCISQCAKQAPLFGEENTHRKQWVEDRLQELVRIFAIDVCGFAILDDNLQVLLRLDQAKAKAWSAENVVKRWIELCPPKDCYRIPIHITKPWIKEQAQDQEWVEARRTRLTDLGWFIKSLKEPIARRANLDDRRTGSFWDGRFRSVAILDAPSLLAICAHIDLSPFAAGIAETPRKSLNTSIKSRVDFCKAQGHLEALRDRTPSASQVNLEKGHWLLPIEDRRDKHGKGAAGLLRGISLPEYVQLIDWSSRLIRPGKSRSKTETPDSLTRLEIDTESWQATLTKLMKTTKYVGTYFGSTARLNEAAARRGIKYVKNVTGRETPLTALHVE